jgi:hypothetical protein
MPKLADRTLQAVKKDVGGETYKFLLSWGAVKKARRKGWLKEDTDVSGDSTEELVEAAKEGDDEATDEVLSVVAAARLPYEEDITPEMIPQSMWFFDIVDVFEKITDTQRINEALAEELGEEKGKKA